jgi:SsrA-binding protein
MKIINRKATYDYEIKEKLEAGINLRGAEVKAIRQGHADLTASFVRIINNQAFLVNARIFPYEYARPENYDPNRTRKLLLHKKQIISIKSKTDGANLTIVPMALYTAGSLIKLEIALGKSKKKFDKKETIKRKDIERDIEQTIKGMT